MVMWVHRCTYFKAVTNRFCGLIKPYFSIYLSSVFSKRNYLDILAFLCYRDVREWT